MISLKGTIMGIASKTWRKAIGVRRRFPKKKMQLTLDGGT